MFERIKKFFKKQREPVWERLPTNYTDLWVCDYKNLVGFVTIGQVLSTVSLCRDGEQIFYEVFPKDQFPHTDLHMLKTIVELSMFVEKMGFPGWK